MGRITGEQSNVQHSLGDGLLGGVPVGVQLRLQTGRRTLFNIYVTIFITRQGTHTHDRISIFIPQFSRYLTYRILLLSYCGGHPLTLWLEYSGLVGAGGKTSPRCWYGFITNFLMGNLALLAAWILFYKSSILKEESFLSHSCFVSKYLQCRNCKLFIFKLLFLSYWWDDKNVSVQLIFLRCRGNFNFLLLTGVDRAERSSYFVCQRRQTTLANLAREVTGAQF